MAENKKVSRYKIREQAFLLCFERLFSDSTLEEIAENALECRELEFEPEVLQIARSMEENSETIDEKIEKYLKEGWKISRLPKVSLAVLRVCAFELFYRESVPTGVAINEAIELAKKYTTPEDAAFINGILGSLSRGELTGERQGRLPDAKNDA
ncbi:MAG: transcription antitermination factor NusB [Oscillospiraceae bacterium]|jgi:N utilization substance protein B|nr:transcription antitermination factor NusB [Oscillospiraceae bacterium]